MDGEYPEIELARVEQLRNFLYWLFRDAHQASPAKLRDAMLRQLHFACVPSHDAIGRFVTKKSKMEGHSVVSIVSFFGIKRKEKDFHWLAGCPAEHDELLKFCDNFYETWSQEPKFNFNFFPRHKKGGSPTRLFSQVPTDFRLLRRATDELKLPAKHLTGAVEALFAPLEQTKAKEEGLVEQCFSLYRYSTTPGMIDKSSMTVSLKRVEDALYVSFQNLFIDDRGSRRLTSGFVVGMNGKVYMIGGADNSLGMKFVGFSGFTYTQNIVPGMIMSLSTAASLICARVVMVREKAAVPEEKLGVRNTHTCRTELGDQMKLLANRVPFTLDRRIKFKDEICTQDEMVAEVARLLRDPKGPRFKYEDGSPFNPAATAEYTYNSALEEIR